MRWPSCEMTIPLGYDSRVRYVIFFWLFSFISAAASYKCSKNSTVSINFWSKHNNYAWSSKNLNILTWLTGVSKVINHNYKVYCYLSTTKQRGSYFVNHSFSLDGNCFQISDKNTTGADALGKYQLAGIHKFINALTTHSELLSHPPSECSRIQLCKHRSQAGVNQLGVTTIPAREWGSCRLCHHSFLEQFLRSRCTTLYL